MYSVSVSNASRSNENENSNVCALKKHGKFVEESSRAPIVPVVDVYRENENSRTRGKKTDSIFPISSADDDPKTGTRKI